MTNAPSVELLPCPFCGGNACLGRLTMSEKFMGIGDSHQKTHRFHRIHCLKCGTEQGYDQDYPDNEMDSLSRATAAWNTRPLTAEIADLRAQLDEAMEGLAHFLARHDLYAGENGEWAGRHDKENADRARAILAKRKQP